MSGPPRPVTNFFVTTVVRPTILSPIEESASSPVLVGSSIFARGAGRWAVASAVRQSRAGGPQPRPWPWLPSRSCHGQSAGRSGPPRPRRRWSAAAAVFPGVAVRGSRAVSGSGSGAGSGSAEGSGAVGAGAGSGGAAAGTSSSGSGAEAVGGDGGGGTATTISSGSGWSSGCCGGSAGVAASCWSDSSTSGTGSGSATGVPPVGGSGGSGASAGGTGGAGTGGAAAGGSAGASGETIGSTRITVDALASASPPAVSNSPRAWRTATVIVVLLG